MRRDHADTTQDTIECPYCRKSHAVKVWFTDGYRWSGDVTTDPSNSNCDCNVYVCPSCGRVSLLDAPQKRRGTEKVAGCLS